MVYVFGRIALTDEPFQTFSKLRRVLVLVNSHRVLSCRGYQLVDSVGDDCNGAVRLTRHFAAVDELSRHRFLPMQADDQSVTDVG